MILVSSAGRWGYILTMKHAKNIKRSVLLTSAPLAILVFTLFACQTIDVVEHPDAAGRWKYVVEVTKAGSEEEGRRARLYYRGKELPGHFSTVIVGETKYDYTIRIDPSDFSGYRKDQDYAPPPRASRDELQDEEEKRGWYFASADQRKRNTPADWIWVERENLEAFVDPDRLYRFINKYQIAPKVEESEPPFQFRFSFETGL